MIKVIIFDADGVLVHGNRKFSITLAEKHNISLEKTLPFFMGPFQECLVGKKDLKEVLPAYLVEWGWTGEVDALLDYWFDLENKLDQDLISYIQELRKKGILCLLATNQEKYRFQYMLDKLGFSKSFDQTYASVHLGYAKPDQEFFEKIIKNLENIKKEEILFWDDQNSNIKAAKEFGIQAELFTSFEDFQEKLKLYSL